VCIYVCVYVCVRKCLSVDILRKSWPIWMKIPVYVAIGLESRTSPKQYDRTNISPLWGGGDFCNSLNPYISKTIKEIKRNREDLVDVKFKDVQVWLLTFFSIPLRFVKYFEKTVLEKSLSGARGRKNVLTLVETRLKYLAWLGIESLPWTAQSG